MIRKIKNSLSKTYLELKKLLFFTRSVNKKFIFIGAVFFSAILYLAIPLYSAKAGIFESFGTSVGNIIFHIFFWLVLQVTAHLLNISILVLNWVISDSFIDWSYTGLNNPIINIGWTLTRDLTNMIFIIILVMIGLGTALKFEQYKLQKLLPKLIAIAFLINFTPVICGLIVDASNIFMGFFLSKVEGLNALGTKIAAEQSLVTQTLDRNQIIGGILPAIIQTGLFAFFDVIASVVILMFAALFVFRRVVIWVLVILSPIAFASSILPQTNKYYKQWWNQFTQWCIIGITAGFFLYLGNYIMTVMPTLASPVSVLEKSITNTLELILPYLVAVIFLWYGLFSGMSTSAVGASAIIGFAQKGARAPGAWAKSRAGKAATRGIVGPAAGKTAGLIGAAARGAERLDKSLGKYKVPLLATKPLKWATRGLETAAVPSLIEYAAQQRRISKPKGWDQMSIPEKERYIQGLGSRSDQLVLASDMKGEGTFQKSSSDFRESILKAADKFKTDPRYKKEVGDILDALPDKVTKKMKIDFDLSTFSPTEINPATGRKVIDEERDKIQDKINAIMTEFNLSDENEAAQILHARGLKPKDISEVAKSSLKSDIFRLATRKMSSAHLQALQNNFDEETVHAVLGEEIGVGKGLNALSDAEVAAMNTATGNQKLFRWAHTTPAGREMLNWSERPIPGGATPPGGAPPGGAPPAPTPTLVPPRPPGRTGASRYPQQRIQRLGRQGQRGGSGRPPGRP